MAYAPVVPKQGAVLTFDLDRERRDIPVDKEIARYVPDASPFTVIMMRARKQPVNSTEFHWWESEVGGYWAEFTAAATANETTLSVTDATIFAAKDIIKVPSTGEIMFVTSSNLTAKTITVVRGYGLTLPQAIEQGASLHRMGNAMEENSLSPEPKTQQPRKIYNYTQVVRTPLSGSWQAEHDPTRAGGNERNRLRRDKSIDHRLDLERILLFGEPKEDPNEKRRMTGGILYFIETNVYDVSGPLTDDDMEQFCEMLFTTAPSTKKRKLLVCSPRILTQVSKFAKEKLIVRQDETTYGVQITQYRSAHGVLNMVTSYTFERDYAGMGIAVDMDHIYYRPRRDTTLRTNIQENDRDGWKDEYFTEFGVKVELERTHAVLTGVAPNAVLTGVASS